MNIYSLDLHRKRMKAEVKVLRRELQLNRPFRYSTKKLGVSNIFLHFHRKCIIEWHNNFLRYCTHLKILQNALEPCSIDMFSGIAEKGLLAWNIYVEDQAISYSWEKSFLHAGAKTHSFEPPSYLQQISKTR